MEENESDMKTLLFFYLQKSDENAFNLSSLFHFMALYLMCFELNV